ncbi:MAG: hypothetical protein N2747_02280 [Chitinophagaceae bacterium]|nr:hypothetical protein [Chitinophagaceae bacterium]
MWLIIVFPTNAKAQNYDTTTSPDTLNLYTTPSADSLAYEEENVISEVEEAQALVEVPNLFDTLKTKNTFPEKGKALEERYKTGLKRDPDFWYADSAFHKTITKVDLQPYEPAEKKKWKKDLLMAIIIVTFFILLWIYLKETRSGLFAKPNRELKNEATDEEWEEKDLFSIPYEKVIHKALNEKNYRLAIRYQFLKALKGISEAGVIKFRADKTNTACLFELINTTYYEPFGKLLRYYEYVWYGNLDISEEIYLKLENAFKQFFQMLNRA